MILLPGAERLGASFPLCGSYNYRWREKAWKKAKADKAETSNSLFRRGTRSGCQEEDLHVHLHSQVQGARNKNNCLMTLLQKYKIQVAGAVIVVDKKKSEVPFSIGKCCDNF